MSVGPTTLSSGSRALPEAPAGLTRSSPALRGLAVLAAAAVLAGGISALTAGPDVPAAPGPPRAPAAPIAEIASVPAGEAAAFGILRRPRAAADEIRTLIPGAGPAGANPALARHVTVAPGSLSPASIAVVPAAGAICLRVLQSSATGSFASWRCQSVALARSGGLIVTLLRPSALPQAGANQYLIGLVPDGVARVTVTTATGQTRSVAVHANVYSTQITAPRMVTLTVPGHHVIHRGVRD